MTSLALATAFISLAIAVFVTYAWLPAKVIQGSFVPGAVALGVFGVMFGAHVAKHRPRFDVVAMALAISCLAMYFIGFFIWLIVACAFGDCL
jgi:hypothetical protein